MATLLGELTVIFTADPSEFLKQLKTVGDKVEEFGASMKAVGESLTKYVTLPLLGVGAASVTMAAQEEAADARMASSLKNVGISYSKVTDAIHANITALETLSGFSDTEIQDSFTDLISITGNARTSFEALAVVTDVAARFQIPLAQSAKLVGKALIGNTDALKRYGISLKEGASAQQVLNELTSKFGGTAAERMATVTGKTLEFKNQLSNAAETLGKALLPMAIQVLDVLIKFAYALQDLAARFANLPENTKKAVVGFLAVVAAIGPLLIAAGTMVISIGSMAAAFAKLGGMTAIVGGFKAVTAAAWSALAPIAILLLKVALLTAVFAFFYSNGQKIASGIAAVFTGAFTIVLKGIEKVLEGWALLTSYIPGVGGKISGALNDMKDEVKIWSDAGIMATKELADGFVEGGGFIQNTIDFTKGAFKSLSDSILGESPLMGQAVAAGAAQAGAGLEGLGQKLSASKLKWAEWRNSLTQTVQALASSMLGNFTQLGVNIATALATGTGTASEIIKGFLMSTLQSIATWAITNSLIVQNMAAAFAAFAAANPWLALALTGVAIAAIGALSATSFAQGGIVSGPTLAMVGDNPGGKEAIIPLGSSQADNLLGGAGGGEQTIVVELDGEVLTRTVVRKMPGELRLHGIMRS